MFHVEHAEADRWAAAEACQCLNCTFQQRGDAALLHDWIVTAAVFGAWPHGQLRSVLLQQGLEAVGVGSDADFVAGNAAGIAHKPARLVEREVLRALHGGEHHADLLVELMNGVEKPVAVVVIESEGDGHGGDHDKLRLLFGGYLPDGIEDVLMGAFDADGVADRRGAAPEYWAVGGAGLCLHCCCVALLGEWLCGGLGGRLGRAGEIKFRMWLQPDGDDVAAPLGGEAGRRLQGLRWCRWWWRGDTLGQLEHDRRQELLDGEHECQPVPSGGVANDVNQEGFPRDGDVTPAVAGAAPFVRP